VSFRTGSFRDWYAGLLDRVQLGNEVGYAQALRVLRCPEEVTGYREVRYPKQDKARAAVEAELAPVPKVEVDLRRNMLDGLRKPTHV